MINTKVIRRGGLTVADGLDCVVDNGVVVLAAAVVDALLVRAPAATPAPRAASAGCD